MKKYPDIYQSVTDTIIEALEKSTEQSFELPWYRVSSMPHNAKTGNSYRGINIPLLWAHQIKQDYKSAIWASYLQWQEIGAQVQKGAKGVQIVFWKSFEVQPDDDNKEPETRMFAKYSTVFNADQVDGFDPLADFEPCEIQAIGSADAFIDSTGADIRHDVNWAYYSISDDYINVPSSEFFRDTSDSTATENYYSTIFHELIHWSGAAHRLDRFDNAQSGKESYAFEELVAEMGAAFLCARTGVEALPRADHAHYIRNWLEALKNDKKFIFAASSQAQKATDYLFSFQEQEEAV